MPNENHRASPDGDVSQPAPTQARAFVVRVLHSCVEVLLGLLLSGGIVMALMGQLCLVKYRCDDLGGIPYIIMSLVIAIAVFCGYMALCKIYRARLPTLIKLDIAAAVATVALWTWAFLIR